MNKVAYRVLNRRTRVVEESFDISFDDLRVRKPFDNSSVTFILESDIPEGYGQVKIAEIDYDTLFGPTETAWESEKVNHFRKQRQPFRNLNLSRIYTLQILNLYMLLIHNHYLLLNHL